MIRRLDFAAEKPDARLSDYIASSGSSFAADGSELELVAFVDGNFLSCR